MKACPKLHLLHGFPLLKHHPVPRHLVHTSGLHLLHGLKQPVKLFLHPVPLHLEHPVDPTIVTNLPLLPRIWEAVGYAGGVNVTPAATNGLNDDVVVWKVVPTVPGMPELTVTVRAGAATVLTGVNVGAGAGAIKLLEVSNGLRSAL